MERDEPLDMPEPRRFSRRSFVKGCIYASAAGVAAIGAGAAFNPLAMVAGGAVKRVEYLGNTLVSGPAPQGLPLMPLAVSGSGDLSVNPNPPGLEGGVLDWYRYCAHEDTLGLQPDFKPRDELIRYFLTEEKKATIAEGWYLDRIGDVINVADFTERHRGAGFNWRSQGMSGKNIITGILIKIDPSTMSFRNAAEDLVRDQFIVPTDDGNALIAYVSFCKHFCCVPGWHESPLAREQGVWDTIFCTCHLSVYDPAMIKSDFFMLTESKDEDEEGAGHA